MTTSRLGVEGRQRTWANFEPEMKVQFDIEELTQFFDHFQPLDLHEWLMGSASTEG